MDPTGTDTKTELALLDFEQLEPFIDIGLTDFLDILDDVIHDVPQHLEKIHSAIRKGDSPALIGCSHSMRGMLANFGCIAMTRFLYTLEYGGTVAPDQADLVRSELENLWQRSLFAINYWEKSIPGF